MPNKDSFTFSDKLRKSKSLPLSKRIPSRIGGDGKAKRTLIQRAQRDLPFIIVAAAALLLLPILSRDTGSEYDGYGSGTSYTDFVPGDGSSLGATGLGTEGELSPVSGFRDPLSLIKRHSGEDGAAVVEGDRDIYNYNDDTSQAPAPVVEKTSAPYRSTARQSIRKAVSRSTTQLNRLSQGKNMTGGDRGSVVRNLAIGAASRSSGGASIPEESRRMALSPSEGVRSAGRSMTGEGLYAEAARSLAAMNKGSGKQALFDAQLRNVDGTPLGVAGGAAGMGPGGVRGGGGGAPNEKFSYSPKTPWWWDFEKMKLMEKWKNWEGRLDKTLSDISFKIGTGLAYCLTTGSEDGSVKYLLGKKAGDSEVVCVSPSGSISAAEFTAGFSSQSKEGDKSTSSDLSGDFQKYCTERLKGHIEISPSKPKTWYQTRMDCLGLKVKRGTKRSVDEANNCSGVYGPKKTFYIKSNKSSDEGTFGVFVSVDSANPVKRDNGVMLAPEGPSKSVIGLIQAGSTWSGGETIKINDKEYFITAVSGFSVNYASSALLKDHKNKNCAKVSILKDDRRQVGLTPEKIAKIDAEIAKVQAKCDIELQKSSSADPEVNKKILSQINADIIRMEAAGEFLTEDQLAARMKRHGGLFNLQWTGYNVIRTCPISDFRGLAMTPLSYQIADNSGASIVCDGNPVSLSTKDMDPGKIYRFYAKITGKLPSGAVVHALRMEKAIGGKGEGNYVIREVTTASREVGDTYYISGDPGQKESGDARVKPINGHGYVYWIITKPGVELLKKSGDTVASFGDPKSILSQLLSPPNAYVNICEYAWGCNPDDCKEKVVADSKSFCKDEDGVFYTLGEGSTVKTGKPLSEGDIYTYLQKIKAPCTPEDQKAWVSQLPACDKKFAVEKHDICKDGDKVYSSDSSGNKVGQPISADAVKSVIAGNKGVDPAKLTDKEIGVYLELVQPCKQVATTYGTTDPNLKDKCTISPVVEQFVICSNEFTEATASRRIYNQVKEDISRCIAAKTAGDINLRVEGHTSSEGTTNDTLSDARAIAVTNIVLEVLADTSSLTPRISYTPRTPGRANCPGIPAKISAFQASVSNVNSNHGRTVEEARNEIRALVNKKMDDKLRNLKAELSAVQKKMLEGKAVGLSESIATIESQIRELEARKQYEDVAIKEKELTQKSKELERFYSDIFIPATETEPAVTYGEKITELQTAIEARKKELNYDQIDAQLALANQKARTVEISVIGFAATRLKVNEAGKTPEQISAKRKQNRRVLLCLSENGSNCPE